MIPPSTSPLRRSCRAVTQLATLLAALSIAGQTLAQDVPVSKSTVYNFGDENPSGASARFLSGGLVQLGDGTIYGTAQETLYPHTNLTGPAGMIYKLSPTGEFSPLHLFNRTDGSDPRGLVLGSDGNLYGVTDYPRNFDGNNTLYRITPAGAFTLLHTFAGGSDGDDPTALIAGDGGNLYGATSQYDAALHKATLFQVTPDGTFTPIYTFAKDYVRVSAMVRDTAGNFYAADSYHGEIGKITPAGVFTSLADTSGGARSLVFGQDGNLYGVSDATADFYGNILTFGTLFRLTTAGEFTTLHTFTGGIDGAFPASLTLGRDGNLYGTTSGGGTSAIPTGFNSVTGTVFRVTPAGVFSHLYTLSAADGGPPATPLLASSDGSLYGTTGYSSGPGTLFRLMVQPSFFANQSKVGDDTYFLAFPSGNYFGFYGFLDDPHYLYHHDLGYEYVFDANDGKGGVYLYDFAGSRFFYTSPTFPFPYLYDFTLGRTLYYYPDPDNVGHYNTNGVRYFYDFLAGRIIRL